LLRWLKRQNVVSLESVAARMSRLKLTPEDKIALALALLDDAVAAEAAGNFVWGHSFALDVLLRRTKLPWTPATVERALVAAGALDHRVVRPNLLAAALEQSNGPPTAQARRHVRKLLKRVPVAIELRLRRACA
jgi:hypothetical protein